MKFRKPLPPETVALIEVIKSEGSSTRAEGSQREDARIAALIEALRAEGRANRREEEREDRGKRLREWTTIALLGATLFAILWQVHEMIKVYGPIKQQADAESQAASAALEESKNSQRTADAAGAQSASAEKSLALGARAWVGPFNASLSAGDPAIGAPFDVSVEYLNTGHEPAVNFLTSTRITTVPADGEWDKSTIEGFNAFADACKDMTKEVVGGSVIFPSLGFSRDTLDAKQMNVVDQGVFNGSKVVLVQGCFRYRTMDKPHFSYFCFFYRKNLTKPANLNICPLGHDAN